MPAARRSRSRTTWFERPKRLSAAQSRAMAAAGRARTLWVSDVTLWEIPLLIERGRIKLALPLDEWLARATAMPRVQRCGMSPAIAREMLDLPTTRDWDPADRVLVATARVLGAALVTTDVRIAESGLVKVI